MDRTIVGSSKHIIRSHLVDVNSCFSKVSVVSGFFFSLKIFVCRETRSLFHSASKRAVLFRFGFWVVELENVN